MSTPTPQPNKKRKAEAEIKLNADSTSLDPSVLKKIRKTLTGAESFNAHIILGNNYVKRAKDQQLKIMALNEYENSDDPSKQKQSNKTDLAKLKTTRRTLVKKALACYREASKIDPAHPTVLLCLAKFYAKHGDIMPSRFIPDIADANASLEKAIEYYLNLIAHYKTLLSAATERENAHTHIIEYYHHIGQLYQKLNQLPRAIATYQAAMNYRDTAIEHWEKLLKKFQEQKDNNNIFTCLDCITQIADENNTTAKHWCALGSCYQNGNGTIRDLNNALRCFEQTCRLAGNNANLYKAAERQINKCKTALDTTPSQELAPQLAEFSQLHHKRGTPTTITANSSLQLTAAAISLHHQDAIRSQQKQITNNSEPTLPAFTRVTRSFSATHATPFYAIPNSPRPSQSPDSQEEIPVLASSSPLKRTFSHRVP